MCHWKRVPGGRGILTGVNREDFLEAGPRLQLQKTRVWEGRSPLPTVPALGARQPWVQGAG